MIPYGYWDKKTRCMFGPGLFQMSSAKNPLTPFYLKPQFEGQKPFALAHTEGVFLFYVDSITRPDMALVYEGVEE